MGVKKNKTTIAGAVFLTISVGLFIYSHFVLGKTIERMSFEAWFIGGFGIIGGACLLDKVVWLDRIIESKFPSKDAS